jgi:hypothetical protein
MIEGMMSMKRTILTAFTIVIACMFLTVILPTMAQYTCGLQSGKYAKYNWSMTGWVVGQSYSVSGTVYINITSVSGTTYSGTANFSVTGGNVPSDILTVPQDMQTVSGDVALGYGSTGFIGLLAVPANMTINSSVPYVGNVTQIGSWAGRSAILVNSSGLTMGQGDTYYDQTTGILLYSKTTLNYLSVYSFDYKLEMTGTDLWTGGFGGGLLGLNPWTWAVIIVIIVAVAAAAAMIMRRKRLPSTPKPTPPQPPPPPPPA